jgi:hypothetical protein
MSKHNKLILQILKGSSDKNIAFNDLCQLLIQLGFSERIRGSHHIFKMKGIAHSPNLQKDGNKAKPYQVRQVRNLLVKYNLSEGEF